MLARSMPQPAAGGSPAAAMERRVAKASGSSRRLAHRLRRAGHASDEIPEPIVPFPCGYICRQRSTPFGLFLPRAEARLLPVPGDAFISGRIPLLAYLL